MRLLASVLTVLFTCGAERNERGPVTLSGDLWCPYNCAPGSERPGFAVEIAREVFGAAGYRVDYKVLNWARCIEDARQGRIVAIIGAIPSDAPDFLFPREPVGMSSAGFAVRRGTIFHFDGDRSLDKLVLGTVADYAWGGITGNYIRAHEKDRGRIQFVSGEGALAKNLAKLAAGRVDVVLEDATVLREALADPGVADRIVLADEQFRAPVFIAFSPLAPDAPNLASILDDGVAHLRRSGRLAIILARYHVTDWK